MCTRLRVLPTSYCIYFNLYLSRLFTRILIQVVNQVTRYTNTIYQGKREKATRINIPGTRTVPVPDSYYYQAKPGNVGPHQKVAWAQLNTFWLLRSRAWRVAWLYVCIYARASFRSALALLHTASFCSAVREVRCPSTRRAPSGLRSSRHALL